MHIQFRSEPQGQQVLTKAFPVEAVWGTAAANVPYDACVTCVIPCLNECENLRVLLPLLRSRLSALCTGWEIIVADDGLSLIHIFSFSSSCSFSRIRWSPSMALLAAKRRGSFAVSA